MEKRFYEPAGLAISPSYTHTVSVEGSGKTIYVSGQVPLDEKGQLVGRGDLAAQVRKAFENLTLALAAAGATLDDLVKTTTYVVGYKPEQLAVIREARSHYLPKKTPPANTLVGIEKLFLDDVLIEIEAIAVVDPQRR
jgi:enamine deaminase RidA (YjgF/YER057c/UK114 family)